MNINIDSFVNRLRNTVSQVAYQVNSSVNTIIPGNPIHRDYETVRFRCSHGCPGFVWSIYDAVKRDSSSIKASLKDAIGNPNLIPSQTKDPSALNSEPALFEQDKRLFSVFLFDKSQLDALPRAERESALDHLKKGVTQLTRLRHPAVLTVHHPLEESRSSLGFVTEHVYGHLEAILKEQRGRKVENSVNKSPDLVDLTNDLGPKDSDYKQDSCELDEIQIKAGLLQVCDGLKFLHNINMLHRNLCLDNIFVDSNNTWKIGGFDFCCNQASSVPQPKNDVSLDIEIFAPKHKDLPAFPSLRSYCKNIPSAIVPNWSCSAPEHSNSETVTFLSDIYSLGILSCALLGKDIDMVDLSYEYGLISDTYKRGLKLRELADKLPAKIKTIIMKYAAINSDSRPSLEDYQNLAIFTDPQVQAIRDLDSQMTWDRLKKIDFFNRLREILPDLSHQVKINRIAAALFKELVNPDMTPFLLPNIIIIAKDSTPTEFKTKIFPHLKGTFRILEPRAVPILLLDNMAILADRAKKCLPEFQRSAFTLIQHLLRTDQSMQEKCLIVLPTVKQVIDELSLTTTILPEIARVHRETTVQAMRVKTLDCIKDMVDVMSEKVIENHVLPILLSIQSREASVIMSATGIIKVSQVHLTKETLACKVIPFLYPLVIVNDLDVQQFNNLITLIKSLSDRVEREQREILGRRAKVSSQRSGALVVNSFKGSNHFSLE